MFPFHTEKKDASRGSATIEAVISFTGFLFVIFTILSVINYCRAQMLISNAVDTATKEITQYSYFYKMSGLQKFSEDISANSEDGKTNLNDVLGTVGDLYSSIGTAVDNSAEHVSNVQNAVEEGDINVDAIQNTLAGIKSDGTNIETSMNSVMNAFEGVQDNPLLYMKSIIAVAGNASLDLLKSHVIAAPLAKSFTAKHFGSTTAEADECLKSLGVVNGLDGLNFKMSTVFSSSEPETVHIVVYYKLNIVQLFDWATLEVPMCKESVARAWLGGDDVQKVVEPMEFVAVESDSSTTDEDSNTTDETQGSEETESEEPAEETVDITGSYWHLGDDGYGYEEAGCENAFRNLFYETYDIDTSNPGWYFQQIDSDGNFTNNLYRYGYAVDSTKFDFSAGFYFHELTEIKRFIDEGRFPESSEHFIYVLYVPENISDEEYEKITKNISDGETSYITVLSMLDEESMAKYADVGISIQVVKAGGNYDYGSVAE